MLSILLDFICCSNYLMQSRCGYCLARELCSSVRYQPFSFGNDIFADMHLYGQEHIYLFISDVPPSECQFSIPWKV